MPKLKYLLVFIAQFVGVSLLHAQLEEADTNRTAWLGALRGAYQQGNVELLRVVGQLDATCRWKGDWAFKTENEWLYLRFFGAMADNDLLSRNYLYWQPNRKFYPYAMVYASSNFRRKIEHRYFGGMGLTYNLLSDEKHLVKASTNVLWEQSRFAIGDFNDDRYDGKSDIRVLRASLYVQGRHLLAGTKVTLFYKGYWQPAIQDRANYRYSIETGLVAQLVKAWSLQTKAVYSHENLVDFEVRSRDFIWTWGLIYSRKSKTTIPNH